MSNNCPASYSISTTVQSRSCSSEHGSPTHITYIAPTPTQRVIQSGELSSPLQSPSSLLTGPRSMRSSFSILVAATAIRNARTLVEFTSCQLALPLVRKSHSRLQMMVNGLTITLFSPSMLIYQSTLKNTDPEFKCRVNSNGLTIEH